MVNDELMHYGVKGQKWGVRRYQNADGTLTAAGRRRSARNAGKEWTKEAKKQDPSIRKIKVKYGKDGKISAVAYKKVDKTHDWSEDAKTARDIKQKSVKQMSNAELKKLNERTRLEQEYSRLNPNAVQQGWKYVVAGAAAMGTIAGLYNNSSTVVKIGKNVVDRMKYKQLKLF